MDKNAGLCDQVVRSNFAACEAKHEHVMQACLDKHLHVNPSMSKQAYRCTQRTQLYYGHGHAGMYRSILKGVLCAHVPYPAQGLRVHFLVRP